MSKPSEEAMRLVEEIRTRTAQLNSIPREFTTEEIKYIRETVIEEAKRLLDRFKHEVPKLPKAAGNGTPLYPWIQFQIIDDRVVLSAETFTLNDPDNNITNNTAEGTSYYNVRYPYFEDVLNEIINECRTGLWDDHLNTKVIKMAFAKIQYLYDNDRRGVKRL